MNARLMRIAMWILLGCAALVLLLLLLPVRLRFFCARGQLRATLWVLGGIPIRLMPRRPRRKTQAPPEKKQKQKKEAPEPAENRRAGPLRQIFAQNDLPDAIAICCRLLRLLCERTRWILRRMRFSRLRLSVSLAGDDAAATALLYGRACAAIYPLLAFLQANLRVSFRRVDLRADFAGGQSDLQAGGTVALRPIVLLATLPALLVSYRKIVKSEDKTNERIEH